MAKQNIPHIISYILLLLFFIIGGIFFRQSFFALIIILLIVLPIISIYCTKAVISHLSLSLKAKTGSVTNYNPIILEIALTNTSFLPVLNININFKYTNLFYKNDSVSTVSLPGIPKKTDCINLSFETAHLGINEFEFINYTITDFLHLYSVTIPLKKIIEIPVLPEDTKEVWEYVIPESLDSDEDEQFVPYGAMTHDLKETREYQPGDSLKNIHWKLSSKTDSLTVKVFETSAEKTLLLLPELTLATLDETIQTLYSLSNCLIKNKEYFKILVFSAHEKEFETITIESLENLTEAVLNLYHQPVYDMKQYALNVFSELNEKPVIHISGQMVALANTDVTGTIKRKEEE